MTSLAILALLTSTESVQPLKWLRVAAYSPDNAKVATAGDENTVRIYDSSTAKLLVSAKLPNGPNSFVTGLVWLSNSRMATSGSDGKVRVFETGKLRQMKAWSAGTSYVSGIATSTSGKAIATSGYDNCAKLWDASSGKLIRSFPKLGSDAYSVAMSRDGKLVAAGGPDGACRIWRASDGKVVRVLKPGQVMSIAFSPDGKEVATDGKDAKYYIYDLATGKMLLSQKTDSQKAITALAFSPDSRYLAVGDYGNQAIIIDMTGELVNVLSGHTENLASVEFSANGSQLLTSSFDATARIWNVSDGKCIRVFPAN